MWNLRKNSLEDRTQLRNSHLIIRIYYFISKICVILRLNNLSNEHNNTFKSCDICAALTFFYSPKIYWYIYTYKNISKTISRAIFIWYPLIWKLSHNVQVFLVVSYLENFHNSRLSVSSWNTMSYHPQHFICYKDHFL